ncbi:hypothetical protein [Nonomuraea antimicrobica]|uniref:hypothetical protein n=1 Tax=Nonomuraea antimicrobica TaxID=561173 RepID=UPI0031F17E74
MGRSTIQGSFLTLAHRKRAILGSGAWRWRLGPTDFWVLHAGETQLYAFRPDEPHFPSDFEGANFYVRPSRITD